MIIIICFCWKLHGAFKKLENKITENGSHLLTFFFSDRGMLFRILSSYWNSSQFHFWKYTIEFVITEITIVPCCWTNVNVIFSRLIYVLRIWLLSSIAFKSKIESNTNAFWIRKSKFLTCSPIHHKNLLEKNVLPWVWRSNKIVFVYQEPLNPNKERTQCVLHGVTQKWISNN